MSSLTVICKDSWFSWEYACVERNNAPQFIHPAIIFPWNLKLCRMLYLRTAYFLFRKIGSPLPYMCTYRVLRTCTVECYIMQVTCTKILSFNCASWGPPSRPFHGFVINHVGCQCVDWKRVVISVILPWRGWDLYFQSDLL